MTATEAAVAALRRFDGASALAALGDLEDDRAAAARVRALWLLRRWEEAGELLARIPAGNSVDVQLARGVVALGRPDNPAWLTVGCGSGARDDEAAVKAFTAAIALDEDCAEAVAGLAAARRMSGEAAAAEKFLQSRRPTVPVLLELAMCAAEQSDHAAADSYLRHALQLDPGNVQAKVAQVELLRIADPRGDEVIAAVEDLLRAEAEPTAVVLCTCASVLSDRLDERSAELVRRADEIGPALPGTVYIRAMQLDRNGERAAASAVVAEGIAQESTSPLLWNLRARLLSADAPNLEVRLHAYKRVLAVDPRDLQARIEVAETLHKLGRVGEARAIVSPMREELPGNRRVQEAWAEVAKQATPWQMPERYQVRHRRDMPSGRTAGVSAEVPGLRADEEEVLKLLTDEAVVAYALSPPVADELRRQVAGTPEAIIDQAAKEEASYRQAWRRQYRHMFTHRAVTAVCLGGVGYFGVAGLIWVLLASSALPMGWRLGLSFTAPVALVILPLLDLVIGTELLAPVVLGVFVLASPIGVVAYGAHRGDGWGGLIVLTVLPVAVGGYALSRRMRTNYEQAAQQDYDVWLETLFGKGLLSMATEISNRVDTAFSTWLPANSQRVVDKIVDIDTFAVRELRRLSRLGRGTFALAGPRGAGKSTLLQRWCAGEYIDGDRRDCRDLAIEVAAPVGYSSDEFLIHLFERSCRAVEIYAREREDLAARTRRRFGLSPRRPHGDDSVLSPSELGQLARNERNQIRHLLSRTTERELAIDTPVAKGKGKYQIKRDDIPLNHPQRVDRFRDFLRKAADCVGRESQGKILVGIDELDRISDGDKAQDFLNELKAVFNVPNCFFLVAVSEDALADFDLKAMGMRTVFDSAFDTIVRVDYLRFQEAKALLKTSMVDVPEQFVALAYVLSGGLARELIRTVDVMGALPADEARGRSLQSVAGHLAQRLLDAITRAAMDRLTRSDDRRAGAALIPVLDEHPADDLTVELLREYAGKLEATEVDGSAQEIRLDVLVLTQYLTTLLDVFDNALDQESMSTGLSRGTGDFETLARVRRYLGANPYGAQELLRAFDKAWTNSSTRKSGCREDFSRGTGNVDGATEQAVAARHPRA